MNILVRFALAYALSFVLGGAAQQAIMAIEGEQNTSFALVPLAACILPITVVFGIAFWRRRTASAISWTALSMLLAMLIFGVAVYILGVNLVGPGIGGNIAYLMAMLVDFYFLLPAAVAVPIHWWLLRNAAGRREYGDLMPKRAIYSDKVFKGSLPFAQATIAGGFMFVCCVGRDRDGKFAAGDVRAQTQQCLDNIRTLIEEAGGAMTDIVKCTVYVTDRANWQPMNGVYFRNFAQDPPHRVSCIVSGLGAPECLVEIDATAYLGKD